MRAAWTGFWRRFFFGVSSQPPTPGTPAIGSSSSITGNFNLTAQLAGSSGRSIQFAGYTYADESKEQLDYRLDVLQEVIERQRIRSEIPELEAKREQMIKGLQQAREILTELEDRQKAGGQLSSQERMNVKNMRINIAKVAEEIEKGDKAISEARAKAGVDQEPTLKAGVG